MNRILTIEEMAKEVGELLEKHGIPQMLKDATPEEREVMVALLMNTFGAGFPPL